MPDTKVWTQAEYLAGLESQRKFTRAQVAMDIEWEIDRAKKDPCVGPEYFSGLHMAKLIALGEI